MKCRPDAKFLRRCVPTGVPVKKVAELSLVLDSAFFFDVHGTLSLALEYMQQHPSAAYDSTYCSEVI